MSRMQTMAAGSIGTGAGAFIVQVLNTPLAPWWVFLVLGLILNIGNAMMEKRP